MWSGALRLCVCLCLCVAAGGSQHLVRPARAAQEDGLLPRLAGGSRIASKILLFGPRALTSVLNGARLDDIRVPGIAVLSAAKQRLSSYRSTSAKPKDDMNEDTGTTGVNIASS